MTEKKAEDFFMTLMMVTFAATIWLVVFDKGASAIAFAILLYAELQIFINENK